MVLGKLFLGKFISFHHDNYKRHHVFPTQIYLTLHLEKQKFTSVSVRTKAKCEHQMLLPRNEVFL